MPSPATAPTDLSTADGLLRFGNLFCTAKVLLTAVEIDLFTVLHDGGATEAEIRERLGLDGRGLADFLRVLVTVGALTERDGRYGNADGADAHLVSGRPAYVGGFLMGAGMSLYPAYGRLAEALRTGAPQSGGKFSDLFDHPAALAQFVAMMDGLNDVLGPELAKAFDFSDHSTVLDIGGCRGNLVAHLLAAHPGMHGQVFDLPPMGPLFEARMAELGLSGRASFTGGDFFADDLPAADVMVCGHVLSDWNTDQRALLLGKAFAALAPGGTLLVYDRMLHPDRDDVENLVASLNLLLVTEGGGEYSVGDISRQASAAGFGSVTHQPLSAHDTLLICAKH